MVGGTEKDVFKLTGLTVNGPVTIASCLNPNRACSQIGENDEIHFENKCGDVTIFSVKEHIKPFFGSRNKKGSVNGPFRIWFDSPTTGKICRRSNPCLTLSLTEPTCDDP